MIKKIATMLIVLILSTVMTLPVMSFEETNKVSTPPEEHTLGQASDVNILAIIPDRYGANTYFNLDNMELFGWTVTLAGLTDVVQPCQWAQSALGIPEITVDVLIDDIDDISAYDVLAIMPAFWRSGEAYGDLLDSRKTLNLIGDANEENLVIWATCAGVRVLAAADVIDGVKVTGRVQFKSEYEAAGAIYIGENVPPVIDQNIITSMRGQYWNKENIEAIATVLEHKHAIMNNGWYETNEDFIVTSSVSGGLWTKTYGGGSADGAKAVCGSNDGGYLVVGYTFSSGAGGSDMYVVNINEQGDSVWTNTYGGSGYEYGYGICPADDGYVLVGYLTSFSTGSSKDVYVVKIDTEGNEVWSETFGGDGLDIGMSVCPADDGFLVCGYTESFGAGENDIYVIKIDETGTMLWEKQYGGSGAELGYQIKETSDGNYIIVGASGSDRANYDCVLIKIDDDGTILWENYYGAPGGEGGYDRGHSVIETSDGGFLIVGESNYGDALNMLVIKTDAAGEEEWVQVFGDSLHDHGSDVIETSDGNYVICGRFDTTEKGKNDIGLIKFNDNGQELWRKSFSMHGSEWATSLVETNDKGLLLIGHTDSIGMGKYDMFIMKTDSEGNSNQQPEKPLAPNGPSSGKIKEPQTYVAVAEDPDNEDVYYLFDWGDNSEGNWLGPFASGETCEATHIWEEQGDYEIRVKARDVNGGESDWSDPLPVIMPKAHSIYSKMQSFFKTLERFSFLLSFTC